MAIVEVSNVWKKYQLGQTTVNALRDINVFIEKGEFISLIGPSGSGKSTLLNMIGCIDKPTEGSVKINGVETSTLSDKKKSKIRLNNIGFIFQSFNLVPVLNVLENVELPLRIANKASARERAMTQIEAVGLKHRYQNKPEALSGGERQRVAIARALVTEPDIVLADEPTANLDSETANQIVSLMSKLNTERQTTFILATHDRDILKYAKRIIEIKDGRVV